MLGEILDDAAHRGNAGAARDDDKLLAPVLVEIETVAVRPADVDLIADVIIENLARDVADPADRKVQYAWRDAADGNR